MLPTKQPRIYFIKKLATWSLIRFFLRLFSLKTAEALCIELTKIKVFLCYNGFFPMLHANYKKPYKQTRSRYQLHLGEMN
jgi:hypothetical protein